ncbi:MAG: cupin domain-containing protein [Anaerolineaceae bacterium]|nr:MAG: cupin domain-containing protein [Anaerolineaceae bacterium]
MFNTKLLPERPDATAPDGSDVRILLSLNGGSMAHFELAEGCVSRAVVHKTVEEVWYFLDGLGVMWRSLDGHEETVRVEAGVCLTIPVGTHFQFRSIGPGPLKAVAVTMPPWPGDGDAYEVGGIWKPTK